jgi:hypothetical protein
LMKLLHREKTKEPKVVDDETSLPRIHMDLTNEDKQV